MNILEYEGSVCTKIDCNHESTHALLAATWEPIKVAGSCLLHIADVHRHLLAETKTDVPLTVELIELNDELWMA